MGEAGAKAGQEAAAVSDQVVQDLQPLGDVSSRKMFGGYGIFEGGAMFALINSEGSLFLKADDTNRSRYQEAGSPQHGKMPYYLVPAEILEDSDALLEWAAVSQNIAHLAKK